MSAVTVLGGSGGILSRKVFENLHSMMAILVLLEQLLRQILFEFFALNFEVFTKYPLMQIFRFSANFADFVVKNVIFVNRLNPLRKFGGV